MSCPSCGTENPIGKRFCSDCGASLFATCGTCGAPSEPGKRFCGDCGSPIASAVATESSSSTFERGSVPAPVAERRLVSVLFLDLVGFTTYAEGRDPETVRETLTQYFAVARDVIGRYGGTVEKFIGDAVMAVWGAPVAREDDAERAVRAALDLVATVPSLGEGIRARAGVLTGDAAVTLGAVNEGMVAGDLVNTAARIQSAAPPGGVLVGETTMRAASAAIAFEDAGEHELKGKLDVVHAWRALRVVAQRGGLGRSDLPEPPFTGRDEELRTLKDALASVGRDGRARLVSITGPGGIGKSRLAWEFEKYVDGITDTYLWHRGRSPAYGDGIAFWALGEIVRRRAGLAEEDAEPETRSKVRSMVETWVADPTDRAWVEPALLTLLGVEPAPAGGRDVLFAAWRIFFERLAESAPVILVLEDLQWADAGLLDFLEHLLEWSRSSPLLVVTLARPELFDRRPDWGGATRSLVRIALEPLPDAAMQVLLEGFVPGLPSTAVDAIVARAEGMPLYAVELVRSLVADGRIALGADGYHPAGELGALTVPSTLRSLIASRLDALEPVDRALVSDASVLGLTFSTESLRAVSGLQRTDLDTRLRGLVRRELFDLETDARSPEVGQHRFVQSLIREVAYGTLARRDRRARHLAVAQFYESLGDEELAGVLASHYVAAHAASDPGPEADAVAVQARLALNAAAARSEQLGSYDQAIAHLEAALELTSTTVERVPLLIEAARAATIATRYELAEQFAIAATDAVGESDPLGAARARSVLGETLIDAGRPEDAIQVLEEALRGLPDDAPIETRAWVLQVLSRSLMRVNRCAEAVARADEGLQLADPHDLRLTLAETLNNKAAALSFLGRLTESTALFEAARRIAHDNGFAAAEIRVLTNMAGGVDWLAGIEASEAAERLARRVGNRTLLTWVLGTLALQRYTAGVDWDLLLADARADVRPADESDLDRARSLYVRQPVLIAADGAADGLADEVRAIASRVRDVFLDVATHAMATEDALVRGDALGAAALAVPRLGSNLAIDDWPTVHAVLVARDAGLMREAVAAFDARGLGDSNVRAYRSLVAAVADGLEGVAASPAPAIRDALAVLEANGARFLVARFTLAVAVALRGAPGLEVEVARARAVFERVGAAAYLRQLDEALETSATVPGA